MPDAPGDTQITVGCHPFFPSHVASGRCFLSAASASAPAGVVSTFAEPIGPGLGLCWMWQDVPFERSRLPVVGVRGLCWLLQGSFECFCCPHNSYLTPSTTCLAAFPCA